MQEIKLIFAENSPIVKMAFLEVIEAFFDETRQGWESGAKKMQTRILVCVFVKLWV